MRETEPFIAAAVQAAPVFLDAQASAQKAVDLIDEAAGNGAQLIAFPEVFIPGYPYWNWILNPIEGSEWFHRLHDVSVSATGPEVRLVAEAAARHGVHVVLGINERSTIGAGTLFNTVLTIDDRGRLIGRHRKLVPTWAEKLTWTGGDGSSLVVHDTKLGPLGALACGENTNTLARFSLLEQGELIHVSAYIALPTAPADYDMVTAIQTRSAAHAFEGKLFNVTACAALSDEIIEAMVSVAPESEAMFNRSRAAWSGTIGPDGSVVGDSLIDVEGIAYAEIDLSRCVQPTQMHNITGHYNRFDVFDFSVDRSALGPEAPFTGPVDLLSSSATSEPVSTDGGAQ